MQLQEVKLSLVERRDINRRIRAGEIKPIEMTQEIASVIRNHLIKNCRAKNYNVSHLHEVIKDGSCILIHRGKHPFSRVVLDATIYGKLIRVNRDLDGEKETWFYQVV